MKSEISYTNKARANIKYPVLAKFPSGNIYIMTSENTGIKVNGDNDLSFIEATRLDANWEVFNGSVTLSN